MKNSEKMLVSLRQQELEKAAIYLQRALETEDDASLVALGDSLEQIGFLSYAKRIYETLVVRYPMLHLRLAQIAYEDGLTEETFEHLEEITSDMPEYVEALLIKADVYQSEGLSDVAYEKVKEAAQLSDDEIIVFALAELEMELMLYQEAIGHYAQLDNRDIENLTGVSTYQRIGMCYASLGKFEAAIEFLEKAVELSYEDQTAFELAVLLLEREETQKSLIYFKQLDTMNPDFVGYEYYYAQSLHAENQVKAAFEMLQKGLAKNEFDTALLLLASQYAYELHDESAAEQYLLAAKEEVEDINEVVLRLTSLYLEQERYEEIVRFADEELENVLACWNIAKAYEALEDDQHALVIFQELVSELKDNPEFLLDYIELLRREGETSLAKEFAERYLKLVPDDLAMQEWIVRSK